MKKLFGVLVFVCLAIGAFAQTQTTVTASNIQQGGSLLASGQVCFQGTDGNNNPIPFRWLGGGQQGLYPFCATVTNGAIVGTLKVPNPQYTVPFNIPYTVRVQDASGNPVFTYLGVQFVGTTFNLDQYTPSNPAPIGYSANYFSFGTGSLTNYLDVNCIPSPSNPISPFIRIYCNNATTQFACLTSAGASCASSTVSLKFDGSDETSTIQTALKSAGYIYIPEKLISVSGISQAASGVVTTSTPHGLIAGDTIIPTTVLGMTQINGLPLTVSSVTDSTHFVVSTNTSGFGAYASGGVFPGIARINPTVGFCAIDNTYLRLDPGTYLKALANSVNQSSGYLMIGNCDPTGGNVNITVDGGIWDVNGANQNPCTLTLVGSGCTYYSHSSVRFANVNGITIKNLTLKNTFSFGLYLGTVTNALVENIVQSDANPAIGHDAVHVNGPSSNVTERHIKVGTAGDDIIAMNADDANGCFFQQGDIHNFLVEDVRGDTAQTQQIRILSSSHAVYNGTFRDFDVTNVSNGGGLYNIAVNPFTLGGAGNVYNVKFENIRNFHLGLATNFDNIEIDNAVASPGWNSLISATGTIGSLGAVRLRGIDMSTTSSPVLLDLASQSVAGTPRLSTFGVKNTSSVTPFANYGSLALSLDGTDYGPQVWTGTNLALGGPESFGICTGACTATAPAPPTGGFRFHVRDGNNLASVVKAAMPVGVLVENQARTAYCTAGFTLNSDGTTVGSQLDLLAIDPTHYVQTSAPTGTWTCTPAGAIWALVQHSFTFSSTSTTFSSALTNGSLIIVGVGNSAGTTFGTPTDTAGNTYADCGPGKVLFNASGSAIQCFYAINTHTTASNVVSATGVQWIEASEWTGNKSSAVLDASVANPSASSGTGGGQNMTSTAATTTHSGDLIIGYFEDNSGSQVAGTGFTIIQSGFGEYQTQSSAGSVTATEHTNTNNDLYGALLASFILLGH